MFDYLQKFNNLPQKLRDKISTSAVMFAIDELEKKYRINLAAVVMRIMIKELTIDNLAEYFIKKFNLEKQNAEQLTNELQEKVLFDVVGYLRVKSDNEDKKIKGAKLLNIEGDRKIQPTPSPQKLENFFSDEDEEEIKKLSQKIKNEKTNNLSNKSIDKKLDKIIEQSQINFGSENLALRFRGILKIYLQGVRDKIDTKQTLIKQISEGGLGFDPKLAEQILKIVKNGADNISNIKRKKDIKMPEFKQEKIFNKKEIVERDVGYDLSALKEKESEKQKAEVFKKLDLEHELAPPPPKLRQDNKLSLFIPKKKPEVKQTNNKEEKTKPKIDNANIISNKEIEVSTRQVRQIDARKTDVATGKIKMDDVKFKPKVMSPIDELRYMDLISFRRLSQDISGIIAKMKEKIELLEEESYTKRSNGIKAWRTSPVNKLYLDMGQTSISKNRPINAIIEERRMAGKEYLNVQEFEAVTDLNRDLRF